MIQNSLPARLERPRFSRLLLAQSGSILAIMSLASFFGAEAALSALLGGLVCLLPNTYFAWRAFRHQGARLANDIVKSFYRAEAGKFGLTAALFTLVFVAVPPSNPVFFFGAYVVTSFTQWLGPWLLRGPPHT